jgi:hypothetical protein
MYDTTGELVFAARSFTILNRDLMQSNLPAVLWHMIHMTLIL